MADATCPEGSDEASRPRLWPFATRDEAIRTALVEALSDSDAAVVIAAMRSLCRVDPKAARQFLSKSTSRRGLMAAGHSADLVSDLMAEIAEAERRSTRETKSDPWRFTLVDEYDVDEYDLCGERPERLPVLLAVLAGYCTPEDVDLALVQVIEELGRIRHPAALEPLLKAVEDYPEPVQAAALRAIGDLGDCSALPALEELAPVLPESIHSSRQYATDALRRARTYAEHSVDSLANPDRLAGREAETADLVRRLAATGFVEATDGIRALLRHDDVRIRRACVQALGRLRARQACRALLRIAEDEKGPADLRADAIRSVGLTRRKEEAAGIVHFLKHPAERLRAAALKAMGDLRGRRSLRALAKGSLTDAFRLLASANQRLPEKAMTKIGDKFAVNVFASALKSNSYRERLAAVEALGYVIGPYAVEALLNARADQAPLVRQAVLVSLAEQATFRFV